MGSGAKSVLISAIISSILSLVIFATLRSDWFTATQMNTLVGGFLASWLFVFSLTAVSNIEMMVFGADFQAKFVPEIVFSLALAIIASSLVHRVCATTCVLFSMVALFFINRISNKYHNNLVISTDVQQQSGRKTMAGKRNKQN